MKIYLTETGLLVVRKDCSFFTSNSGEFRRLITSAEVKYLLRKIGLPDFNLKSGSYQAAVDLYNRLKTMEIPLWHYLWSTSHEDYSNYKWGTCNNGGDYSFHTSKHFFARRMGGRWEIRAFETHSTSAEFSYDELTGSFQSNLQRVGVIGIAGNEEWIFSSRTYSGEDEEIILDQLLEERIYTMQEAIEAASYYIPERDSHEEEGEIEVSKEESDKRCLRLNEIGYAGK